jgi:hypothetical protein
LNGLWNDEGFNEDIQEIGGLERVDDSTLDIFTSNYYIRLDVATGNYTAHKFDGDELLLQPKKETCGYC